MKNVLFSLALGLVSVNVLAAQAQLTSLAEGDNALSYIQGKVVNVEPLCPDEEGIACFVNGTVVDVVFGLNGCADHLGPVAWSATETQDGKLEITVAAVNIHNADSLRMFCYMQPTEKVRITLINQYGKVEAKFIQN